MSTSSLPNHSISPHYISTARCSSLFAAIIALLFVAAVGNDVRAQTTVDYLMTNSYFSQYSLATSGGNSGTWEVSSSELGMYNAWEGGIMLSFRELKTAGDNTGSVRALQAGDRFSLTLNATTVRGEIGFSLGTGIPGTLNFDNRDANSRITILETDLNGQFFTTDITSGGANFNFNTSTTRRDYVFNVTLTSDTTANVSMSVGGNTYNNFDVVLGGSAGFNIDAFSFWLSDDYNGTTRADARAKNISVQNTGQIDLGSSLTSGQNVTVGVINDGLAANSTSTVSTNNVGIGGAGQVNLVQSNAYSGTTTISNGAFAEIQNAHGLGSTASGTTVNSGGTLKIWSSGGLTTAAEALTISGTGVGGSAGALLNEGGNNTYAGAITLGAASRINATTNTTLTLDVASDSAITGTHNLTFGGNGNIVVNDNIGISTGVLTKDGNGRLTISGAQNATGGITVSGGSLFYNSTNSGSGAVTVNSGATLAGTGSLGATTIKTGGTMNPGNSPGTQTYASLAWEGGAHYNWQVYDAAGAAGTGYDTFVSTGALSITATSGSKFNINLWSLSAISPDVNGNAINFTNTISTNWVLGTFGSISGFASDVFSLNTVSTNGTSGFQNALNGTFSISTNSTQLLLVYTATASSYTINVGTGVTANQGDGGIGGAGQLTGAGASVTKIGAGTVVMTNSLNDYTGSTTVAEGGMSITVAAPSGAVGALGNATTAVNLGAPTNAAAANFNFGAAVESGRALNIVAGTGAGGTRSITTSIGSGTATQSGNVTVGTNTAITAASGSTLAISGALSGSGTLNINGAGVTVLSGNSTSFSGAVTNQSGSTLRVGNNNGLGTGGLTLNGGTLAASSGDARTLGNAITVGGNATFGDATGTGNLTLNGAVALGGAVRTLTVGNNTTLAGIVSGTSGNGLTKSGNGTLTLSGANTFGGNVDITAGRLNAGGSSAIGNSAAVTVSNGATFGLNALEEIGSLAGAGNVSLGGLLIAGGNGSSTTFSGVMSGADGLVKKGAGTMTLSGANNYTGETFIVGGGALYTNSQGASFTNTINLGETNGTVNASLLLGTTLNNPLTVRFGSSNNVLNIASAGSGAVTYGGNVNLFNNNLTIGQAAGGTGVVTFGASTNTFFLGDDGTTTARNVTVNGSHTIAAQVTGGVNNRINIGGGGTLTLSGANTFSGGAQVTSGTILVGNNAALGTGTFTFNFNGAAGSRVLASSSGTGFTLNNDFNVFDDSITIGQTTGGTGSLVLGGAGKNFNLGSDGEVKNRVITVNGSHTIAGNLIGGTNNSLIKAGSGTITLAGATNSFGGGLFIDAGVVNLTGANFTGNSTALDIGGGVNGNAVNSSDAALQVSAASSFGRNIRVNAETNASGVSGNRAIEFLNTSGSGTLTGTVALEKTVTANVTNSAATGVLSGVISGAGGITKTGAGTLTLSGAAANSYSGDTLVSAGTLNLNKTTGNAIVGNVTVNSGAVLLLSASNQVDSGATDVVTLSGGTIRRASGVSEVFGDLNVTANSFLDFSGGTGGTIEFSGLDYTPSALAALQLVNFTQGNTLIIRNTSNWASEINSGFTFGGTGGFGGSTFSDGTFTITAIPEPSTYVAAAGLLALFLWPVRRRLFKDAKSILGLRPSGRDRIEAYRNA